MSSSIIRARAREIARNTDPEEAEEIRAGVLELARRLAVVHAPVEALEALR